MYRLVAYAPDGVRRFPVVRDELVIGSEPTCDVVLPYTGVAQQHARLVRTGETLRIEDLGSRRGLIVSGKRVREADLQVLDEIRVGGVTLLVEDVVPQEPEAPPEPTPTPTPSMGPRRMLEHLSRLSDWVLADAESRTTLESLVGKMLQHFGGGALYLLQGELDACGVKLVVASDAAWVGAADEILDQLLEHLARLEACGGADEANGRVGIAAGSDEGLSDAPRSGTFDGQLAGLDAWICHHRYRALERTYYLVTALPHYRPAGHGEVLSEMAPETAVKHGPDAAMASEVRDDEAAETPGGGPRRWTPSAGLRTVGDLLILGLVHHVGHYEPILPGRRGRRNLTVAPGLVVGESQVMRDLMQQLEAAVEPADGEPVQVLLRGEVGVGKELLARSLHLSSGRRHGPFVTATAVGATAAQLEAEVFGAEIPGREVPVRRQGKLQLAHGGTLYLDGVDRLPLSLQARLVRFLRSGEVEPRGGSTTDTVDVRLIISSGGPLEPLVARDLVRVDLAYRLSQVALDVPPLRQRREDLPLLIQSHINRFCHETGKRVQGIAVKALKALLSYDFPGNLPELENIARQLVYLCPSGQPIDVQLLPERVRTSPVRAASRVDEETDLNLDKLVADCERAAIREALRRSRGNKSQAARDLGLSRNGLAMKMQRLGLAS